MNQDLSAKLETFGLSKNEMDIYLSLLEHGNSLVTEISKITGVNRSTAYFVLEMLQKKGLVVSHEKDEVKTFSASPPETLLHSAEKLSREKELAKDSITDILPDLKALHKGTKHRPRVQIFEGNSGLREIYFMPLNYDIKDLLVYADSTKIFDLIPDYITFVKERIKRGVNMISIGPDTPAARELTKLIDQSPLDDKLALIDSNKFLTQSDLAIYGDVVSLSSIKDKFGIIIESKEIADMFRLNFDLAWEEAKRLDKRPSEDQTF